jgi:hypothetical protein
MKRLAIITWITALVAFGAIGAHAKGADAEADVKLVANDRDAARANTAVIEKAMQDGEPLHPGPFQYYVFGTAHGPARTGSVHIVGASGRGWPRPSGDTRFGDRTTVFTQLDGTSPIIELNSDDATIEQCEFRSRYWWGG